MAKYTLVTTVKDEGPYILEWLAYHHVIGFDQFFLSSNDCSDHTDDILRLLESHKLITYNENSTMEEGEPEDPQRRAYARARRNKSVMKSDYVAIIDGDEFFNIHTGDGTLAALFEATGEFDLISPTWRVFGSSGNVKFKEGLITEQFDQTARPHFPPNFRFWGVKTMFRPAYTLFFGIHRPHLRLRFRRGEAGPLRWLNGSGKDVYERFFKGNWNSDKETYGHDLVQINHYMVRSAEAFLMKRMRGTANTVNQDRINYDYFQLFDTNFKKDDSITRHSVAIRNQIDEWMDTIPGLKDLHRAAVHYHYAQIAIARADLESNNPEVAVSLGLIKPEEAA